MDFLACYSSPSLHPRNFTLISCYKNGLAPHSQTSILRLSVLLLTCSQIFSFHFAFSVSLFFFLFFPGIPVRVVKFPVRMALLPDQGAEIVIPVCAVIGIIFSLVQWFLVSKVKLSQEHGGASAANNGKNGYSDYLIEEEEGINDQNVVAKCAEIQSAISEGQNSFRSQDLIFHSICVHYVDACLSMFV